MITVLESYKIVPDGGRCMFTLRDENGNEMSVQLGVLEARAISDSLLAVAARMQLARQNGRSMAVDSAASLDRDRFGDLEQRK